MERNKKKGLGLRILGGSLVAAKATLGLGVGLGIACVLPNVLPLVGIAAAVTPTLLRRQKLPISPAAIVALTPAGNLVRVPLISLAVVRVVLPVLFPSTWRGLRYWRKMMPILWGYYRTHKESQRHAADNELYLAEDVWRDQHRFASEAIFEALVELKGFYLKLGQLLASKSDLLPQLYTQSLSRLLDQMPAMSYSTVARIIESDLGISLEELFLEFDEDPLASATIAQVHRAMLDSGELVAVKVQHPGVRSMMLSDLANIRMLSELMLRLGVDVGFDQVTVIEQYQECIPGEFDFAREAWAMNRAAGTIAACLGPDGGVRVPRPILELTGDRVLTMEFLEGQPLLEGAKALSRDARTELMTNLIEAFGAMIFLDGLFHTDPHTGNLLLLADGRTVGLLDWGQLKELDADSILLFARLTLALAARDHDAIIFYLTEAGLDLRNCTDLFFEKSGYILFDTRMDMAEAFLSPMDPEGHEFRSTKVDQMPPQLFMVVRVIFILRGILASLQVDVSASQIWMPYAIRALESKGCDTDLYMHMNGLRIDRDLPTLPWKPLSFVQEEPLSGLRDRSGRALFGGQNGMVTPSALAKVFVSSDGAAQTGIRGPKFESDVESDYDDDHPSGKPGPAGADADPWSSFAQPDDSGPIDEDLDAELQLKAVLHASKKTPSQNRITYQILQAPSIRVHTPTAASEAFLGLTDKGPLAELPSPAQPGTPRADVPAALRASSARASPAGSPRQPPPPTQSSARGLASPGGSSRASPIASLASSPASTQRMATQSAAPIAFGSPRSSMPPVSMMSSESGHASPRAASIANPVSLPGSPRVLSLPGSSREPHSPPPPPTTWEDALPSRSAAEPEMNPAGSPPRPASVSQLSAAQIVDDFAGAPPRSDSPTRSPPALGKGTAADEEADVHTELSRGRSVGAATMGRRSMAIERDPEDSADYYAATHGYKVRSQVLQRPKIEKKASFMMPMAEKLKQAALTDRLGLALGFVPEPKLPPRVDLAASLGLDSTVKDGTVKEMEAGRVSAAEAAAVQRSAKSFGNGLLSAPATSLEDLRTEFNLPASMNGQSQPQAQQPLLPPTTPPPAQVDSFINTAASMGSLLPPPPQPLPQPPPPVSSEIEPSARRNEDTIPANRWGDQITPAGAPIARNGVLSGPPALPLSGPPLSHPAPHHHVNMNLLQLPLSSQSSSGASSPARMSLVANPHLLATLPHAPDSPPGSMEERVSKPARIHNIPQRAFREKSDAEKKVLVREVVRGVPKDGKSFFPQWSGSVSAATSGASTPTVGTPGANSFGGFVVAPNAPPPAAVRAPSPLQMMSTASPAPPMPTSSSVADVALLLQDPSKLAEMRNNPQVLAALQEELQRLRARRAQA